MYFVIKFEMITKKIIIIISNENVPIFVFAVVSIKKQIFILKNQISRHTLSDLCSVPAFLSTSHPSIFLMQ